METICLFSIIFGENIFKSLNYKNKLFQLYMKISPLAINNITSSHYNKIIKAKLFINMPLNFMKNKLFICDICSEEFVYKSYSKTWFYKCQFQIWCYIYSVLQHYNVINFLHISSLTTIYDYNILFQNHEAINFLCAGTKIQNHEKNTVCNCVTLCIALRSYHI